MQLRPCRTGVPEGFRLARQPRKEFLIEKEQKEKRRLLQWVFLRVEEGEILC
jgi:hypothetical protein